MDSHTRLGRAFLALTVLVLAGCGGDEPSAPEGAAPETSPHLLARDLPGAVRVLEAKKAEDGAVVSVWGRVARTANGVFALVDDEDVAYCGKERPDPCRTPWDYCCENPDQVRAATLVVEARGADGREVPAAEMGIRPLDLVALSGTIRRGEDGQPVLHAGGGWFRRERPAVPDYVTFP